MVRKGNTKAVSIDIGAVVGAVEYNLLVGGSRAVFKLVVVYVTGYVIGAV